MRDACSSATSRSFWDLEADVNQGCPSDASGLGSDFWGSEDPADWCKFQQDWPTGKERTSTETRTRVNRKAPLSSKKSLKKKSAIAAVSHQPAYVSTSEEEESLTTPCSSTHSSRTWTTTSEGDEEHDLMNDEEPFVEFEMPPLVTSTCHDDSHMILGTSDVNALPTSSLRNEKGQDHAQSQQPREDETVPPPLEHQKQIHSTAEPANDSPSENDSSSFMIANGQEPLHVQYRRVMRKLAWKMERTEETRHFFKRQRRVWGYDSFSQYRQHGHGTTPYHHHHQQQRVEESRRQLFHVLMQNSSVDPTSSIRRYSERN